MADTLQDLTATAAAAAIRDGDLTSAELVAACLDRVAEHDEQVRAWARVDARGAMATARARDATTPSGALHGVPIGVKDLIDTADMPTAYGSPIYAGHRPARDAACVRRLRDAGAVILGKTVTTEFALFHPGPTRNPRDPARTPGGSSSGSAAAVADRMVPVALGTQTAGSIVRPASFCGIHGFKPTFDAVPTAGVKPIGPGLDTVGSLARDIDDLALVTAVMADDPVLADSHDAEGSVAFAVTYEWDRAEPSTRDRVAELAEQLGLPTVTLPPAFAGLVAAQMVIMDAEAAVALDAEYRNHADLLSDGLVELVERGRAVGDDAVRDARALAQRCRAALPAAFDGHDALLVPSVIGEAPLGLAATGDPLFCRAWTLLGTPAVAIPGLFGPAGAPVGVQVVARPGRDVDALAAARSIERGMSMGRRTETT